MKFDQQLVRGKIIKRYKRFLSDIKLPNGTIITAHTPNTGSMKNCWQENWPALLSKSDNPKRKLLYTLEMTNNGKTWIGVNTSLPNKLVEEAIHNGTLKEASGYEEVKREFKVGSSRLDFRLKNKNEQFFIEVKNVTLVEDDSPEIFYFPDSVSKRGQKHIQELIELKKQGHRCALVFTIQREDAKYFSPAAHIDPDYAQMLREAFELGVEILPYQCKLTPKETKLSHKIKVKWP